MDFNTLKQKISVIGNCVQLGENDLSSPSIAFLFQQYLPSSELLINNATLTSTDTLIQVTGIVTALGVNSSATATFFINNAQAELTLLLQPFPPWSFVKSFPVFSGTLFDEDDFTVTQALFILNSSTVIQSSIPNLAQGLNLQVGINLPLYLQNLEWFFNIDPIPLFSGPIIFTQGIPEFCLLAQKNPVLSFDFQGLINLQQNCNFALINQAFLVSQDGSIPPIPIEQIKLWTDFICSDTTIPVALFFNPSSGLIKFEINPNLVDPIAGVDLTPGQVGQIVPGMDLKSHLPSDLQLGQTVKLQGVLVAIGGYTKVIEEISVVLEVDLDWTLQLGTQAIQITAIEIQPFVFSPGNRDIFSVILTGILEIGLPTSPDETITLDISLQSNPDGSFYLSGKLDPDAANTPQLKTLLDFIFTTHPPFLENTLIGALNWSLNLSTGAYTFEGELADVLSFSLDSETITLSSLFALIQYDPSLPIPSSSQITGNITFADYDFMACIDVQAADVVLILSLSSIDAPADFDFIDIIRVFCPTAPALPDWLQISPQNVTLTMDITNTLLILSVQLGVDDTLQLILGQDPLTQEWGYAFSLSIFPQSPLVLSRLPLVSDTDSGDDALELTSFEVIGASDNIEHILDPTHPPPNPVFLAALDSLNVPLNPGLSLNIGLRAGQGTRMNLLVDIDSPPPPPPGPPLEGLAEKLPPPTPSSNTPPCALWITLQKSFGPLHINRIGFAFLPEGALSILPDATVALGELTLGLMGISIHIPLQRPFTPSIAIDGLGLSYNNGLVGISGSFLKIQDAQGAPCYVGGALIKIADRVLSVLGVYEEVNNQPSLFVDGILTIPLIGGPPYLFVEGLAAGVGYNRDLILPDISSVGTFPLIQAAMGSTYPNIPQPNEDPIQALIGLLSITPPLIPPAVGSYWVSAGLKLKSFGLVDSIALINILFNQNCEISLLGLSVLRLPQGEEVDVYAYTEMALEATLNLNDGSFKVQAQLTSNSYVLTPNCYLTGGFAFFNWFSGDHQGDFVITLGGYHPLFAIPPHYPQVPRLGFSWPVDAHTRISGGAYFALTPSCIMAGGDLDILFSSGDLRAWFIAHTDLLVEWRPFYFTAFIGVHIGVSCRVNFLFIHATITMDLGASLELWGPPTGGNVDIDLSLVSFSISFGQKQGGPAAVDWTGFISLLSAPSASTSLRKVPSAMRDESDPNPLCFFYIQNGLLRQLNQGEEICWIVSGSDVAFTLETHIPLSTLTLNVQQANAPVQQVGVVSDSNTLFIRPMQLENLTSTCIVTLGYTDSITTDWLFEENRADIPESLWGALLPDGNMLVPAATLLTDRLVGLANITPKPAPPLGPPPLTLAQVLAPETLNAGETTNLPLSQTAVPPDNPPTPAANSLDTIEGTLMADAVRGLRTQIIQSLSTFGISARTDDPLTDLANNPASFLNAPPMMAAPSRSFL